jgi:hypothetical protein
MSARARLAADLAGVSELEELSPVSVHLVKAGANGFRPLAAKAKGGQSSLVAACQAAGVALPARARRKGRKGTTVRLTEGP